MDIIRKRYSKFKITIIQITVGITEFAQSDLGEIVHVELPKVGTKYNEGDSLAKC